MNADGRPNQTGDGKSQQHVNLIPREHDRGKARRRRGWKEDITWSVECSPEIGVGYQKARDAHLRAVQLCTESLAMQCFEQLIITNAFVTI